MNKLKVTLCQVAVVHDRAANLANAQKNIVEAANRGSNLVILPECFSCPYGTKYFSEYAETIASGSPTYDLMSYLSKEQKIWIITGSIPEKGSDGKYFNTSMTFGPDGSLKHLHRKIHLFRINTAEVHMDEGEVLSPGCEASCVDMGNDIKFGVGICFDIRYPQLSWRYASQGSSFLVYPGAFNMVTGPLHWELAGRARAVDTQQYVLLCSPARNVNEEYVAWGHSMVVDPVGTVIGQLEEKEGFLDATLDFDLIGTTRKRFPILSGERKDIYHLSWQNAS